MWVLGTAVMNIYLFDFKRRSSFRQNTSTFSVLGVILEDIEIP